MKIPLLFLVVLVSCLLCGSSGMAQELMVSGTVTSSETGDLLPGANILLKGTNLGVTSDINGKFELRLGAMTQATLVISYVGFKTVEIAVTSSTASLDVELEEDVLKLSEVVVTGIATSVKRRNLANAVATVSARELVPIPAQTLERALTGKFAGITVSQNTGAPGGGIFVDFRGISTIEGATQPLYVVDGVIVNNAAIQSGIDLVSKAAAAGSDNPQGQPTNRIADINPGDIETIEVLKGASAAALYGSKATNGVVIITTRQGTPGKSRIDVSQQIGFNSLLRKIGTRRFTRETAVAQYGVVGGQLYDQGGGGFVDYEDVMYGEEGRIYETSVSASGGSDRTQFYISGLFRDEGAIVKRTGYEKYGARLNLNHKLSDRLKVNLSTNFTRTESDRAITGNDNTNTTLGFSLAFTPSFLDIRPVNGVYPNHQFNPSNPVHTRDVFDNNEVVYRTFSSLRLNWNILKTQRHSLDFIVQTGVDFFSQENKVFSPPELQFERNSGQPGASLLGETESTNSNLYLNLAHIYRTPSNIGFTTSGGLQIETQDMNNVLTEARGLIVTQRNVDQAASINAFQDVTKQRENGFYVQEEVDLKEKIYLTLGVRGDNSSVNGDPDKFYFFPKASASVRLSQYGFWESLTSISNEFKLRVAYGETGNLPPPTAKFTSLLPRNTGGLAGLLPAVRRGSPDIQPERSKELELGFDATLFRGNGSLEFTFFKQDVSELILIADLPPSSGFEEEFINGGEMRTTGVEVSLGLTPIRKKSFRWTSRVNFYTTDSEITQLDVDPFNLGGFATFLGTYRIENGVSPTTIVGAELDPNGKHIPLGNETPDFQMSFNNVFNFGNFQLSFLWDWKQGGEVINLGKLITDLGGTTEDYDTGAASERLSLLGTKTAPYVEDGTYWKLREATLTYSFSPSVVMKLFRGQISYLRVGIGGRNLIMTTDYTGYDPEVSQFGNVGIGRSVDTLPFPSSRSFYFNVSFGI